MQRYVELLRGVFAGRRIILASLPLAGATRRVAALRKLGSGRCFVLATGLGTGDLPNDEDAEHVLLDVTAGDVIDEFRQTEQLLASPPPSASAALDAFDPDHSALVVLAPVAATLHVGDRPVYGGRRPEWVALEDKTVCDALFDEAGVARPDAELVAPKRAALLGASDALDRGAGVVWSGDAREGFNGGGVFVRWIRPDRAECDIAEAVDQFSGACDRVRVAPFIEGVPCSIHGFVCDDGVAALRPVELVNLRPPTGAKLQYAGAATYFDPPEEDREVMRDAARSVGGLLRDRHAFRGALTIDGILGADGWVPTELNPRFGAGLGYASSALPDLPLELLHFLVVAGDGSDVSAVDLEQVLLPAADATRWGGGWSSVSTRFERSESTPVVFDDDTTTCREPRTPMTQTERSSPVPARKAVSSGSNLSPERTPIGAPVASRVVAALSFADRELGTAIGPLSTAVRVR